MSTCSNCGREIPEGAAKCPACGQDVSGQAQQDQKTEPIQQEQQAEPRVRAVLNIPRRDQDPLPERPASDKTSGGKFSTILLVAVVALFLVLFFLTRK